MKKNISRLVIAFLVVFVFSFTTFVYADVTEEMAFDEGYHKQTIGCGSKALEDWKPGCCAGVAEACTQTCTKTIYCD